MAGEAALPSSDEILASAAKFLIEGGEDDAASVLPACSSAVVEVDSYNNLVIRLRAIPGSVWINPRV